MLEGYLLPDLSHVASWQRPKVWQQGTALQNLPVRSFFVVASQHHVLAQCAVQNPC